jgi:hypothetical protein
MCYTAMSYGRMPKQVLIYANRCKPEAPSNRLRIKKILLPDNKTTERDVIGRLRYPN